MANRQIPGPNTTVRGTIDAVPCPHCGKPNDMRTLSEQQLLDTGHQLFCDHCEYSMEVVAIRPVTLVSVRKDPKGGRARPRPGQQAQQPQRRQIPQQAGIGAAVRRLLGGPKR